MKCTCVYATAKNTDSVRKGFEMGGYLKHECDACKAANEQFLRDEAEPPRNFAQPFPGSAAIYRDDQ